MGTILRHSLATGLALLCMIHVLAGSFLCRRELKMTTIISNDRSVQEVETTTQNNADNRRTESDVHSDFWWLQSIKDTSIVFDKETRLFVFPTETERIWIDVGVHKESDFLINLDDQPDLFLLGFEPSSMWKPCPHDRCAVFWAACTPDFDIVKLNLQNAGNLCNSILKPDVNTTSRLWRGCVTQQVDDSTGRPKTMAVPGVPLHALLDKIPSNVDIEYIKIDAQGYDLEVMKGALPASDRIQVVSLEAMDVADKSKLLYHGQPTLGDIKATLETVKWRFVQSINNRGVSGEINAFFVANDTYLPKVPLLAKALMANKEGEAKEK